MRQTALSADFAAGAQERSLRDLFRAHTSPAFTRLVERASGVDQAGEPTTSLATCEKVPRISGTISDEATPSGDSENTPGSTVFKDPLGTAGRPDRVTDATEAIRSSISRDRGRQEKVVELVMAGEVAHAKRLARCGRQSVELECGDCGGSNFVPIHCDSRLCPDCGRRKMGRVAGRYRDEVASWDHPTMLRLSLPGRVDPDEESLERAVEALRGAFGRLRNRKVPPSGEGYTWDDWARSLRRVGERDLAARLRVEYVEQGRWIPVEEVLVGGFYAVDIKQKEDRRLNVHLHVLADCAWLPQVALSELWDDLIGAPVVDVRRVYGRNGGDAESAVMETIGYAAKAPEYQEVEDEVAYYQALRGSKLVQPFGALHGNTPKSAELRCEECDGVPLMGWEYLGVIDEVPGMMGSAPDGDRPPDPGGRFS